MRSTMRTLPCRSPLQGLLPAVSLLLGGCLARPFEPAGARPFATTPPMYTDWWGQMETCAQVTAPIDRVEWYAVPGNHFATPDGPRWGWWAPPHTIYITEAHLTDEPLVEHEMLHDLLQTGAHPALFQTCGVAESISE